MNLTQAVKIRQGILKQMYKDSLDNIARDLGLCKQTVWKCGNYPIRAKPEVIWEILRRKLNYQILKERMEPYRLEALKKRYGVSGPYICRLQNKLAGQPSSSGSRITI